MIWKIVIWHAAPITNNAMNTASIGTSRDLEGTLPADAVVGAYGGPGMGLLDSGVRFMLILPFLKTGYHSLVKCNWLSCQ